MEDIRLKKDVSSSVQSDSFPAWSNVSAEDMFCRLPSKKEEKDRAFNIGLNQQRLERKHTNVTLECHGVKFPAHNYVLASRSNFFFKMFSSPSMGPNPTISFDEYQPNVVDVVLDFLYTDDINLYKISHEDLDMLVACCNELEIVDFEPRLLKVLLANLNSDNFHFALLLASSLKDTEAEAKILSYVCQNLDVLWPNDKVMVLEEQSLHQVLKKCSKAYPCHDVLLDCLLAWIKNDLKTRQTSLSRLMEYIDFDKVSKSSASSLAGDSLVNSDTSLQTELMKVVHRDLDEQSVSALATPSELSIEGLEFDNEEPVLMFVGRSDANSATAVTYDVHNRQWFEPCDLKLSLCHNPGIGFDSEQLIFAGGRDLNDCKLTTVKRYGVTNKNVINLPDLRIARENPLVFPYERAIFVFGGSGRYSSDGLTHGEYLSDINAIGWKVLPPMRAKRSSLVTACVSGTDIYITGGGSVEVERFNVRKMVWEVVAALSPQNFIDGIVFLANAAGKICAISNFKPRTIHVYCREQNNWHDHPIKGTPPETILHAIGCHDKIYILAHESKLFILDVTAGAWSELEKVPPKLLYHPCFMTSL